MASLQESENRYRILFDSAGDAIAIHDMKGRFLEVNRALCERLGYSRRELLQMTTADTGSSGYASIEAGRGAELRRLARLLRDHFHTMVWHSHHRRWEIR